MVEVWGAISLVASLMVIILCLLMCCSEKNARSGTLSRRNHAPPTVRVDVPPPVIPYAHHPVRDNDVPFSTTFSPRTTHRLPSWLHPSNDPVGNTLLLLQSRQTMAPMPREPPTNSSVGAFTPASTHETNKGAVCAVCLCDMNRGETVEQMPFCGHSFHQTCINQWLLHKTSCPLCRSPATLDYVAMFNSRVRGRNRLRPT